MIKKYVLKNRISTIFVIVLLLCSMVIPSAAVKSSYQKTETIETEFGLIEIDTALTVHESLSRSNTKKADYAQTFRYSGKIIAEVTLSTTFGYDGKTAWVISSSGSHTTYDGWGYSGQKITTSGGTATLTATLSKLTVGKVPVNIPLTCSPSGQIS